MSCSEGPSGQSCRYEALMLGSNMRFIYEGDNDEYEGTDVMKN